jgi:hypothetical protein
LGKALAMNNIKKNELLLSSNDLNFFHKNFITWKRFREFNSNLFYYNVITKKYELDKPESEYIEYIVNNYGFRSDNFDKKNKIDVLFSGCSETTGEGGILKDCWAYDLYSKTKANGYYNLSIPGSGYDTIIDNLMRYLNKFGIPKNLFILFPNIDRKNLYNFKTYRDKNHYFAYDYEKPSEYFDWSFQSIEHWDKNSKEYPEDFSINSFQYKTLFAYRVKQIEMLEFICNSLDINLNWTTYCKIDQENFNNIKTFNNYFVFDYNKLEKYIFKYKEENPNVLNAVHKIDGHNGIAWHKYVSDMFAEYLV